MYNVWALATSNGLKVLAGDYKSITILPISEERPDSIVINHEWVRIGKDLSDEEAELLADMYPHVPRAKC